ncbi:tapetum determinant protein [Actinidia rufa]|uniref:Tapetum determinant protein n=1 Tax=Actinidia rufa TaxID=165716 RepID=A0A7J0FZG9_9ERIC|nr:tapetum determinant protein [Actinidia rufa]
MGIYQSSEASGDAVFNQELVIWKENRTGFVRKLLTMHNESNRGDVLEGQHSNIPRTNNPTSQWHSDLHSPSPQCLCLWLQRLQHSLQLRLVQLCPAESIHESLGESATTTSLSMTGRLLAPVKAFLSSTPTASATLFLFLLLLASCY